MTYWRLHYHIIWSTKDRQPILTPKVEKVFYGVIYGKAEELELKIHAAGNVEDHAHVVLSIPPKIAVADCVRHLKSASAYALNQSPYAVFCSRRVCDPADYQKEIKHKAKRRSHIVPFRVDRLGANLRKVSESYGNK